MYNSYSDLNKKLLLFRIIHWGLFLPMLFSVAMLLGFGLKYLYSIVKILWIERAYEQSYLFKLFIDYSPKLNHENSMGSLPTNDFTILIWIIIITSWGLSGYFVTTLKRDREKHLNAARDKRISDELD